MPRGWVFSNGKWVQKEADAPPARLQPQQPAEPPPVITEKDVLDMRRLLNRFEAYGEGGMNSSSCMYKASV